MKETRLHLRILLLILLLLGSIGNGAWADTKNVTYHVITLPFGGSGHPMAVSTNNNEYRIEAIKMTVTQNDTDPIKLPSELKSPLMKYDAYFYYEGATREAKKKIFPSNDTEFHTYTFGSATNVTGKTVSELTGTDVYVIYIWDDDHDNLKEDYGKKLDITGGKEYNVEFTSSTGTGSWFYALNMDPGRGNRGQAVPSSEIKKLSDLYAEEYAIVKRDIGGTDRKRFNFRWKLTNNDPYNIILQSAYNGDFVYREDNYYKKNNGAQYFGSMKSSTEIRANWVTNEINQAYTSTTSVVIDGTKRGWFRGYSGEGRASKDNGAINHLFFSFTLLNHPNEDGNYTLAVSYAANLDGEDWVPNSSGQYLIMQHDPEKLPYAGPKFMSLTAADRVNLYEIRDYNFKVKTPLTNTILSSHFKWSDYGKDSLLINYVPDTLLRKYTTFDGTYADAAFTTERTTFYSLYSNDEPDVSKPRDIWLKYSVSASIPFEAGNSSATYDALKWYNIYVNKEEKYSTWYDYENEDHKYFNTSEGHSKYRHESHFAFIGDPYELRVVNRKTTEDASNNLRYMKLSAPATDPLVSGTSDEYTYPALTKGTALIIGNKYYTTDPSTNPDQFTAGVSVGGGYYEHEYVGRVSDGSNYYEEKDQYEAVPAGTLTAGKVYYTSVEGNGIFISNGTESATGTNYYEYVKNYVAVLNGTPLTIGKTYYTSDAGDGKFVAAYLVASGTDYHERLCSSNWEIIYDNNTGDFANCFRLRQCKTFANPVAIGWGTTGNRPLNGDGSGSSTMARLSVLELPLMDYYYYIVDKSGRIAVMAKEEQITGTTLNYAAIPEVIRSSFLYGGTLTFKTYASSDMTTVGEGMTVDLSTSAFTTITITNSDEANQYKNHIFVTYTDLPALLQTRLVDDDSHSFNVILNNKYIYYDAGTIKSKSNFNAEGDSPGHAENLWVLGGEDPYAMIIRNKGAGLKTDKEKEKYVKVTDWAAGTITWVADDTEATRFIIKSSTIEDAYEVMATTSVAKDGSSKIDVANSVDASVTYYNIGRVEDGEGITTVKMYDNATYAHGYAEIRFQLKKSSAKAVKYILIDRSNNELLEETGRFVIEDAPMIPAEIFSPLVGYKNYTYWRENPIVAHELVPSTPKYGENERFSKYYTNADWENNDITVYITYVANDLVDLNHTTMYLLKFEQGDQFRQEDGSDGLLADPSKFTGTDAEKKALYQAVYPYCSGDCNFFIYGQKQYELQQEGAASTRTRWAWYVESSNNDPYHVKILTRQTETYDGLERSGYFSTRTFSDYDDGKTVVTALVWPNISGVQSTEYMVLGNVGQYQLVTTYPIAIDKNDDGDTSDEGENDRYVVKSFEQYWKTYDTVKKKLLDKEQDLLKLCVEKDRTDRPDGSIEVPLEPASLRDALKNIYGFHSYDKMAYAKRWNGYNASGEKKKGWESVEHWFQTINMGSGYFDLIPTTIDPALILLDQHGWEIMRKPLPSGPDDPNKAHKYEVLGAYDSPMVKEYIFWASAKKRSGLHQYYLMDKRIGGDFTSTSLTSLPPYDSENVKDAKGNHNDEYVTYIVKEEYANTYTPSTKVGTEFLISQGDDLAKKGASGNKVSVVPDPGSVSQYIINNIGSLKEELWYVKPNADIDTEMGYGTTAHSWTEEGDANPNAYDVAPYKNNQVASIISVASEVKKYGGFSFSNGFDPYNIQISSVGADTKYFTMAMTSAKVEEGAMYGDYTGSSTSVSLADKTTTTVVGNGYDNSKWAMTNQTFMAVQDAEGNMQLMPRFDHNLRMRDFGSLVTPTAEAGDPDKLKETVTRLYRPFVYNYRIIDNEGHESLRYQSGGDLLAQTPDHFKSPLAKDFKYYKNLTYNSSTKIYTEVANKTNISSKEITASLAGAGLTASGIDANNVYVRYAYDEDADNQHILQGKWLTMQLNEQDVKYTSGTGIVKGDDKPNPVVGNTNQTWQWKFLMNPYLAPDPYAVQVFSRLTAEKDKPMSTGTLADGLVTAQIDGTANYDQHFALLSHEDGYYALAVARTEDHANYYFLNGAGLSTPASATTKLESGVTGATGNFDAKKSQIQLFDDVVNTYTYKVYTNDDLVSPTHDGKYGVLAISDTQSQNEADEYMFVPTLPPTIKTPLLNDDQFIYYESEDDMGTPAKEIKTLYGLYDGEVYVRYKAYDPSVSNYLVPNDRNNPTGSDPVDKGDKSNDAPLRLDNVLPYNIIWYQDNMMKANGAAIDYTVDQELQNDERYIWTFEGDDPYAIKIRHRSTNKYVHEKTTPMNECELSETPTTFMLLNRDGYEYGVLAKTGDKTTMLSGNGNELTTTTPTKFIIFSLGTLKVVYHLVLANIGNTQEIAYRHRDIGEETDENYSKEAAYRWNETDGGYTDAWDSSTDKIAIEGTTKRNLSNTDYQLGDEGGVNYPQLDGTSVTTYYCKDVGPISLGDSLTVPNEFERPNVNYFFVVREICDDLSTPNVALNTKYKGLQLLSKEMSMNEDLIGKIIYIDIVYRFNTDLESNNGNDFIKSIAENKWYTLETNVNGKTYLAQYTNAWGFELKEGRGSHFTNDFLWTPIGDPYGFQLMNRYMDVNSGDYNLGEKNRAIFSRHFLNNVDDDEVGHDSDIHTGGQQILMGNFENDGKNDKKLVVVGKADGPINPYPTSTVATNSVYELLQYSDDPNMVGYFKFHPVANTKNQTQVYFGPAEADDDGDGVNNYLIRLKTASAPFMFGLSPELFKPYFDRAGYVGGLTKEAYNKAENQDLVVALKSDDPVLTSAQLMRAQALVYNSENIVPFATGYYRLHSPLGISGIDPSRYVSGYTHKTELTGGEGGTPIPMHFYEENSSRQRQFTDFKDGGFTPSPATCGDLSILPVERDPASIFYFEKVGESEIPGTVPTADKARYNLGTVSTQGLYVKGQKGQVTISGTPPSASPSDPNIEETGERPAAVMTDVKGNATKLFVMDLGGGVLLIHDNVTQLGRRYLKYLSYDYSNDTEGNSTIYDMKLTNHTHTDHAKFCMQPVQMSATKGINELPLTLNLNKGGDGYYYATFCAPFDVLLTDADNDAAFVCKVWDTEIIHLKKVGKFNTEANGCPTAYKGNNRFVPAGTPVIIRSKNSSVTMALPTTVPSTTLADYYKNTLENVFTGEYLEQLLATESTGDDDHNNDVFVFGLPMKGTVTRDANYYTEADANNGRVTVSLPQHEETGVGFYVNVNYNRESAADMGSWQRNNRYVYGNRIYYRAVAPSGSRRQTSSLDFIPVVFDDDDDEEDKPIEESLRNISANGYVYDLQGRCVASGEAVRNGSWRNMVAPGVYIVNGKKVKL